jgi:hypothetical protein
MGWWECATFKPITVRVNTKSTLVQRCYLCNGRGFYYPTLAVE